MGLINVRQPHRTHVFHILSQNLALPLLHVAEEKIANGIGSTLKAHGKLRLLNMSEQRLNAGWIELLQILECEHQRLDLVSRVAIALLEHVRRGGQIAQGGHRPRIGVNGEDHQTSPRAYNSVPGRSFTTP